MPVKKENATPSNTTHPKAPKTRGLTQTEFMDTVELTLRESANAVNNIGAIIRLTAGAVFAFLDTIQDAKNIQILDDPEGTRSLKVKKLSADLAKNVEKKIADKK